MIMSSDNDPTTMSTECPNRLWPRDRFGEHLEEARDRRLDVIEKLIEPFDDQPLNEGNEDEKTVVEYDGETVVPFGYQKGLGYETDFGNTEDRYEEFIAAVRTTEQTEAEYPAGGSRPLVSPPSAHSVATEGTDPWIGAMPPAPEHDDPATFLEMLEVYLATHVRDVPFAAYDEKSDLADHLGGDGWLVDAFEWDRDTVADALPSHESTILDWIAEPGDGLFRDDFPGCRVGPYASQHLVHDVPIGAQTLDVRVAPFVEGPFGTTFDEHAEIVRSDRPGAEPGHAEGPVSVESGGKEYAHAGIDLASQVRDDPAYQPYLLAALQLFLWGVPYADDVPYESREDSVLPYIDGGAVALLDLLGRVTRNALLAAWHQKWYVHRRLRPETYAGRLQVAMADGLDDPFDPAEDVPAFTNFDVPSGLFDESKGSGGGSALVPLTYPEGSPAHPAYPSGHSTIAGACATVLKTFFAEESYADIADRTDDFTARVSPDGGEPRAVDDPSALTVHGEINKLASNVGMGRIFAGVHYRTDHVYGMMLGEQIAVATLCDHFNAEERDRPPLAAIDVDEPLTFEPLVDGLVDEPTVSSETFAQLREGTVESGGNLPG